MKISRLKSRKDFLRAQKGIRRRSSGLTVELCATPDTTDAAKTDCRVGFTASKKVGNSVARNRAKRRMRALAAEILPTLAEPGHDYVLIARPQTIDRPFDLLRQDLTEAVTQANRLQRKTRPAAPETSACA